MDEDDDQGQEPVQVYTRGDWDRAVAEGTLRPEHILDRLDRIALREFGETGPMGVDDAGFMISLIAEGVRIAGGARVVVHTRDHPPPHVHIVVKGREDIRINLETGDVYGELPAWVKAKQLNGFRAAVIEGIDVFAGWWEKAQGDRPDVSWCDAKVR